MAEEEEAEDKDEDDDVPVVVRLRLERLAGSHRLVRVSVRLDLADHFFLHSASVAFHGGAYFSGCGASTFVPEDSGDCGSNSVSSSSSEHHFILETCKPGTPRPIDESVCRKASHDQCNFNDSCMLEVAVRTREERVTVVSEAAAGSRWAEHGIVFSCCSHHYCTPLCQVLLLLSCFHLKLHHCCWCNRRCYSCYGLLLWVFLLELAQLFFTIKTYFFMSVGWLDG